MISIKGLKQPVKIGWSDAERAFPRILVLNLELDADFGAALESDDLADTVDYTEVISCVQSLCASRSWRLVEKLVGEICERILAEFSLVKAVSVEVEKDISEVCRSVSVKKTMRK